MSLTNKEWQLIQGWEEVIEAKIIKNTSSEQKT